MPSQNLGRAFSCASKYAPQMLPALRIISCIVFLEGYDGLPGPLVLLPCILSHRRVVSQRFPTFPSCFISVVVFCCWLGEVSPRVRVCVWTNLFRLHTKPHLRGLTPGLACHAESGTTCARARCLLSFPKRECPPPPPPPQLFFSVLFAISLT